MTQREIKALLEHAYTREQWKKLITTIFPGRDVFARPVEHEATTVQGKKQVQHIRQFGDVQLSDGNVVGLFEVSVAKGVDLSRNRVAIRKAVEQPVKQSGNSGALIAFVDDEQGLWRFSFYNNSLKEDGTWDANNPKRYTYLLGEGEKCLTAARQFETLAKKTEPVTLKDLLEAFSVEKVSKAFFGEYKKHYQDFVQFLTGKRMVKKAGKWVPETIHGPNPALAYVFNGQEKEARDFCKKLMGRLVFLYFLQKKRWLGASSEEYTDGDTDFVSTLFKTKGNNDFFQHVLVDLFFDTLNNERPGAKYKLPSGQVVHVPFLNGGLFDKDELDKKAIQHQLIFPPELFSKPGDADDPDERGFLDFLNAYNFTVHEAGPEEQTLAVDPEMLGHIFENLLEDNKDKGAFYTPKEIVHYMCQESLTQYLKNYLAREVKGAKEDTALQTHLRTFLKDGTGAPLSAYSGPLLKALYEVKVCDPAIGSGAFPMGILHEIFQAVYHLQEFSPDEFSSIWGMEHWEPAEVKLRIIQRSIYGVDIERGAVDIARLRFWLSIIVDERAPRTLPNLDYKIVEGDSLLGRFNGEVLEIDWDLKGTTDRVNEVRAAIDALYAKTELYFRDQPPAKKAKLEQEIRALKIALLTKQLELNRDKFTARMISVGRIGDLTKKEMLKTTEQKMQLAAYEETLGKLRALAKQKDKKLDYFDWHLDFPEVLNVNVTEDPGFDIVIGNPPYIRQELLGETKEYLAKRYAAVHAGTADLLVYFFQVGHELLRSGGCFSMITSRQWMKANYGKGLRKYMSELDMLRIVDFGELPVFDAATFPAIYVSRNQPASNPVHFTQVKDLGFSDLTTVVSNTGAHLADGAVAGEDWIMVGPEVHSVLKRMDRGKIPLGSYVGGEILYGIKTGFNEAFIIDGDTRTSLVHADKRSAEIIKPYVKGDDVRKYHTRDSDHHLLLVRIGTDMKRYPAIMEHLKGYQRQLEARWDKGEHWWELRACAYYDLFEKPKILYPDIAKESRFTLSPAGQYFGNTCYFIPNADLFLLGVLNSTCVWFYYSQKATVLGDAAAGGRLRFFQQDVVKIPIPKVSPSVKGLISERVDRRLKLDPGPAATALEREIDVLVCKLYGLSWEQAKVVDPELALSQAEYDAIELPDPGSGPGASGGHSMVSEPGVTGLTDEGTLFGQPVEEVKVKKAGTKKPSKNEAN